MGASRKLKSLALILRSLPPSTQKTIFEQLPLPLVQKISDVDLSMDETLTQEDWDFFSASWPEFAGIIQNVREESKVEQSHKYLITERPRIREYIECIILIHNMSLGYIRCLCILTGRQC